MRFQRGPVPRLSSLLCLGLVRVYAPFPAAGEDAWTGPDVEFVDVTAESGISFVHENAATSEKFLIETMGGAAAWLDYDGDGLLDFYVANSTGTKAFTPSGPLRGALYRNVGDGTFEDVTQQARVGAEGLFGMGVAVGDYDNDGDPDLAVTGFGRIALFDNNGKGAFRDIARDAGVDNPGKWGSSAAWFDFDNDGWLDFVVANYLEWSPDRNLYCGERRPGYRSYCHPNKYSGQAPTLFRNLGDGSFEDVTESAGMGGHVSNGLGVVCFDFDRDGWMDVFIANDSMPNSLFRNVNGAAFEEVAFLAGVALGENGEAEAGMGVDAADYDGDGWPDLYMTHLDFEFDRLYRNAGDGTFLDATFEDGIGYKTFDVSGFGTRFFDYDNDGWRDLFVANGHVLDNIELFHEGTRYQERKLVFRNVGGDFEEASARLGPAIARPRVSRAAAFADYDNDGDTDVLSREQRPGAPAPAERWREPQPLAPGAPDRLEVQPGRHRGPGDRLIERIRAGCRTHGRWQLPVGPRPQAALRLGRLKRGRHCTHRMAERPGGEAARRPREPDSGRPGRPRPSRFYYWFSEPSADSLAECRTGVPEARLK